MATNSLRTRVKRLEQLVRLASAPGSGGPLVVRIRRFFDPDGAFTGVRVNQEFFSSEFGEPIAETERRVVDIVRQRCGPMESHRQIVRLRMTPVEELPE